MPSANAPPRAPDKISKEAYRQDIERLKLRFLDSKGGGGVRSGGAPRNAVAGTWKRPPKISNLRKPLPSRDQVKGAPRPVRARLRRANRRAPTKPFKPRKFSFRTIAPGLKESLQEILELPEGHIRSVEGIDIAHFQGEATVGSLVCFIDGPSLQKRLPPLPHQDRHRCGRLQIDPGSRLPGRYRDAGSNHELFPDVILIDGGLGAAPRRPGRLLTNGRPPADGHLAGQAAKEEIYIQETLRPAGKLSRTNVTRSNCSSTSGR